MPVSVDDAYDFLGHADSFADDAKDEREDDIEEKEHEEFTIGKAYTVGDPGTVVVHVEYASLAGRAVVASEYV